MIDTGLGLNFQLLRPRAHLVSYIHLLGDGKLNQTENIDLHSMVEPTPATWRHA